MIVRSEHIKKSVHIEEIIEHYTGQALKNDRMCCPFHQEKTASFFINRKKQYFKCFGCGEGGDIFKFVQMYFGCDFKTALKLIGKDFNITDSGTSTEVLKETEAVRKKKAFLVWQRDTYCLLRNALWFGKEYLELNRPMLSMFEITDDYALMTNDIMKTEFYFDEFLKDDKEFYKNYRKEAQNIAGRILSRCDKRQNIGADIRRTVV